MYSTDTREQFFANQWKLVKAFQDEFAHPPREITKDLPPQLVDDLVQKQGLMISSMMQIIDDCRMDIHNLRALLDQSVEGNSV